MDSLHNKIINILGLESDIEKITIVDGIKLIVDLLGENKLKTIFSNEPDKLETKMVKDIILDANYELIIYISNNYFANILLDIYFVLNNPYLYDSETMKIMDNNLNYLMLVPNLIQTMLHKLYSNQKNRKFFNKYLLQKWRESLSFTKITEDKYYEMMGSAASKINYDRYTRVWNIFDENVKQVKKIVDKYYDLYKDMEHIPGCLNIGRDFYLYCARYHTGLPIGTDIPIDKVFNWAVHEFRQLKKTMKMAILNLEPSYDKNLSVEHLIKNILNDKKYYYTSKHDFITSHKNVHEKYKKFYVQDNNFPLLTDVNIIDFHEEKMSGGYWFQDTFYINTYDWDKKTKFECTALMLHETIPGHHLQISYDIHAKASPLLYHWFFNITNGYCEGWGLFSEKLGFDFSCTDILGILSMHMMRTLRVIVDILIHYHGIDPEEIIKLCEQYFFCPASCVRTEIYRYVCLPGQALCYKIGNEVLKCIFVKKFNRNNKLIESDALEFYKSLIRDGIMPLNMLCDKFNIEMDDLFNIKN